MAELETQVKENSQEFEIMVLTRQCETLSPAPITDDVNDTIPEDFQGRYSLNSEQEKSAVYQNVLCFGPYCCLALLCMVAFGSIPIILIAHLPIGSTTLCNNDVVLMLAFDPNIIDYAVFTVFSFLWLGALK